MSHAQQSKLNPGEPADHRAGSLLELLYDDLRAIAAAYCRPGSSGTLQPTMIVHEAYLKLAGFEAGRAAGLGPALDPAREPWRDREHFLAIAATAMRQVLVDYARRRRAAKRGSETAVAFADAEVAVRAVSATHNGPCLVNVVELDDALRSLEAADPRAARVVELRYFVGMTVEETARTMGLGRTSVEASWRTARAWLLTQLHPDGCSDSRNEPRREP